MKINSLPVVSKPHDPIDWLTLSEFVQYKKPGALIPAIAPLFKEEGNALGINWAALWCMSIIETGYFQSDIYKKKRNLFGLGAIDSDPAGAAVSFRTEREAVRAGAQHLAVYGGAPKAKLLKDADWVMPRSKSLFSWGYYGLVKHFENFGGTAPGGKVKWASNPKHGQQILALYNELLEFAEKKNPLCKPIVSELPIALSDIPESPMEVMAKAPTPTPASEPPATKKWKTKAKVYISIISAVVGVAGFFLPPPIAATVKTLLKALEAALSF